MIYADNAATTKLDMDAFEAMKPFLLEDYGNVSQPYSFSRTSKKALRQARESIANCINAEPEEIYFTSGGTESDNWAIKGCMESSNIYRSIITSEFEHHAVLNVCRHMESCGYPVTYLHPSKDGFVTPDILNSIITDDVSLYSIMMVNNEIGTIQPIKKLCKIAHQHGGIFHTDAVQAVGHIGVDVKDLNVDMLSCSAHKFNGPKGIGFLYIKKGITILPYMEGGAQEFGMRAGTENVAAIVGMATALTKHIAAIDENREYLGRLEQIILQRLYTTGVDFIRNGAEPYVPGNLSLSFKGFEGDMLLHRLDLKGIMVSTGSACDSRNTQISHVLKAIETDEQYAIGTIRISLGRNNTNDEAVKIADALISILKKTY